MGEQTLKEKTAKGLLWGGMSNGMIQVLSALLGIVLLRLLTPDDYGKIAVLVIFSSIASNLQESGFVAALCNKKEPLHEDYNAVFWFNIIVSIGIYIILFFCAPLIADFYHEPVLVPLSRYLFLSFVISSFGTVQRAYLFGHLMVKQSSLSMVTALVVSNLIGILMAWNGFAFWGIATQTLIYIAVIVAFNWYYSPWRPTFHIDLRPAWRMFGFSSKLLVTYIFNQLTSNVFGVLLGKFYNTELAGLYNNARKWDDMCINTINGMVTGVAQPVLAQVRDENERYCNVFRKMLRFVCFVSFPAMFGMGLVAREFILITVGPAWEASAALLSLLSIYGAFYPIMTLYSNLTISRGKSGINMFCTIALCVLIWTGLIALQSFGLYTMVYFFISINILWLFVWHYFAWRLTGLSLFAVMKDVVPFLVLALGVMALTWWITSPIENIYVLFVAKVIVAAVLYVGLTYLSGAKIMRESIAYIKKKKVEKL
ncbi:MAG: lipopolysaccharide biosynthesis protein [Prevotellaceae bacterium]|nr:lipopolysaccharide biosynthesis protein [Prevotellaceae bacterium]